ncbi:MAG: Era-like GTP-binding protein [Candidatus Micrarchaeota archaeon]
MLFENILNWFRKIFKFAKSRKNEIRLGIYGSPNTGKTTLANRLSMEWVGEAVGLVSEIPHETRSVQRKEKITITNNGNMLTLNLYDLPGVATKVDYRIFLPYGFEAEEARQRAKEATRGIVESIRYLDEIDAALVVVDSTAEPLSQVNLTLVGNLEARKIPFLLVANKTDLPDAKPEAVQAAFPEYSVVPLSALTGRNMEKLYSEITEKLV